MESLEVLQIYFFLILKSRNYSERRFGSKNSHWRKKILKFKYLLILLKTLDYPEIVFSYICWKTPYYLIWHTNKTPLCNPPNPFSKLRVLNVSMSSVPLHFGSSDLTFGSYRTKCELVIGIQGSWQRSHVPCFNNTSLYCVTLQRWYLNTGYPTCLYIFDEASRVCRKKQLYKDFLFTSFCCE